METIQVRCKSCGEPFPMTGDTPDADATLERFDGVTGRCPRCGAEGTYGSDDVVQG